MRCSPRVGVGLVQTFAVCLAVALTLRRLWPKVLPVRTSLQTSLPGLRVPWLSAAGVVTPAANSTDAAEPRPPGTAALAAGTTLAPARKAPATHKSASVMAWHRQKPKGRASRGPPKVARPLRPPLNPRLDPRLSGVLTLSGRTSTSAAARNRSRSAGKGTVKLRASAPPPPVWNRSVGKDLGRLTADAFVEDLDPCVVRLMAGKEPRMLATGIASLGTILVVHGTQLRDRAVMVRHTLAQHGMKNWSFINAFDGDAIDPEAQGCFFGPWIRRISGESCCNRESSSLKPHLAFLAMVTKHVQSALILEDDIVVSPSPESLRERLSDAAARLKDCDMVRISKFSIAYMVSNLGARKLLHYSLSRGGKKISNPMDWQQQEVARSKYAGFRDCEGPHIFSHYGHGTNQGGHAELLQQESLTATRPP
uniref:Glycosyltransferase family 25 protein n=1 Tax=Alexandrium catenella TaxID=2925 RepID=A0A7S1WNP7_ALECA